MASRNDFPGQRNQLGPYTRAFAMTASNDAVPEIPTAVYVTGAGNLVVVLKDMNDTENAVTLPVVANQIIRLRVRKFLPTSTATIIGLA